MLPMSDMSFYNKTDSAFHIPKRGPGRLYYCPPDLALKYSEVNEYVQRIANTMKNFLQLESSVRMLLDHASVNPAVTVIAVPFSGDNERIYQNLARLIYDQLWAYYISADPKTTHHGLTNLVMDGQQTSLIRRETEKLMQLLTYRTDLAARVMMGYKMDCEVAPINRDVYMKETVAKGLELELGVRMFNFGEGTNRATVFLPYGEKTQAAIDRIYYNIEHIIHQNLVAYDELHDHYLPVSTELVLRELEGIIDRSRHKGNTRKKVINGLKLHSVMLQDPSDAYHISLADLYYDKINRIDLMEEAAQRSRELFSTALIRSGEITKDAGVNIDGLPLEQHVFIERPPAKGFEARQAAMAAARPAAQPQQARRPEQRQPVTVKK